MDYAVEMDVDSVPLTTSTTAPPGMDGVPLPSIAYAEEPGWYDADMPDAPSLDAWQQPESEPEQAEPVIQDLYRPEFNAIPATGITPESDEGAWLEDQPSQSTSAGWPDPDDIYPDDLLPQPLPADVDSAPVSSGTDARRLEQGGQLLSVIAFQSENKGLQAQNYWSQYKGNKTLAAGRVEERGLFLLSDARSSFARQAEMAVQYADNDGRRQTLLQYLVFEFIIGGLLFAIASNKAKILAHYENSYERAAWLQYLSQDSMAAYFGDSRVLGFARAVRFVN